MTKRNEAAFDNWWACLRRNEREVFDRVSCRRAFFAGFSTGVKPQNKRFAFTSGKRRVTVHAPTCGAGKLKAEATLNKRSELQGRPPPRLGWFLKSATDKGASA